MKSFRSTILSGALLLALSWVFTWTTAGAAGPKKKATLKLQSNSFQDGGLIPEKYTCKGTNISPELYWKDVPPKTKTFALVVEDPDAPTQTWIHWVVFNIPNKPKDPAIHTYELLENFPRDEKTREGIVQGANDFNKIGYDGPCPPGGSHRYYFKLYALDSTLNLPAGVAKFQLVKAMEKHILAQTQIMGLFGK
jgi:Raf kinase inhibitor-like YbhB/YbcL family protein